MDSEEDLVKEFNAIAVGVMVIDEDAKVTRVNDPLLNYFNRKRADFIGRQFGDAVQCKSSRLNNLGCGFDRRASFVNCEMPLPKLSNQTGEAVKIEFKKSIFVDDEEKDYWFPGQYCTADPGGSKKCSGDLCGYH